MLLFFLLWLSVAVNTLLIDSCKPRRLWQYWVLFTSRAFGMVYRRFIYVQRLLLRF
jgi:hypothetical protein